MRWSISAAYSPSFRRSSPGWSCILSCLQEAGGGASWVTYSGITRLDWVNLHNYTSLAFATLLIIHMLLHWRFFRNIRKTLGKNAKEPCVMTEVPL